MGGVTFRMTFRWSIWAILGPTPDIISLGYPGATAASRVRPPGLPPQRIHKSTSASTILVRVSSKIYRDLWVPGGVGSDRSLVYAHVFPIVAGIGRKVKSYAKLNGFPNRTKRHRLILDPFPSTQDHGR